jgi:hypothetical protein
MMRPTTPRRLLPEHEETKDSAKTHQDIVSKLLEHTGCKIFMIDAQCEVVLTLSPEQLFEILSRQSFELSVSILQGLASYLFSRFEREKADGLAFRQYGITDYITSSLSCSV